ncbi:hypothetical protein C4D60_Mb00t19880 [Musa balbisiana]|uniref:Protein kinase domain-containing protein n=1 Tax=Musa balbisiana TaxID=52838 RepID=A0A4S8I5F1_MUSBA|nr:hypothetical protein C4D60_Mb00t19880 [Musa balbisiana]
MRRGRTLGEGNFGKVNRQVAPSTTKIYGLEYVNGGELFDINLIEGKLSERKERLFQHLIDASAIVTIRPEIVGLCKRNHKVSDFAISALPQHLGLMLDFAAPHMWGAANYLAPEVISTTSFHFCFPSSYSCASCLTILVAMHHFPLSKREVYGRCEVSAISVLGFVFSRSSSPAICFPFDDRNLAVLYRRDALFTRM